MSYSVLLRGKYIVAALTRVSGVRTTDCPAVDFLAAMANQKQYAASSRGYKAMFQRYADFGRQGFNGNLLHEVNKNESIYEFIRGDLRVLCFFDNGAAMLTNGYLKKSKTADPQIVQVAINAKKMYFNKRK